MKSNNIDYFFSDFLFNREISSKSSWNQYIDILFCNSSHDEWRESLKSRPEPYRFAKVHKYIEPHPLWSLRLQHPEYTLKLFELINFFLRMNPMKCCVSFVKEMSTIRYSILF